MQDFFIHFSFQFAKSVPLFCLIGLGYALVRWCGFGKTESNAVVKFAFNVSLTAMLFRLLAQQFLSDTQTDPRLLIAFFGACAPRDLSIRCHPVFENRLGRRFGFRYGVRVL